MKKLNKIAIIGVGLIGGSIGLAIKKRKLAGRVIGIFRRNSTLKRALKCNAVDSGTTDLAYGVKDADMVILASPVFSIPVLAKKAIKYAKKGAIITDAGSTKAWIVREIEGFLKRSESKVNFVGSHPMAGSEHGGVEFARADLFEGSPCIVTKTGRTDRSALKKVASFWKALGGRVEIMDPSRHDRSASLISHLPHVVAFGVAGAVERKDIKYAAEGFKDTTRVASSDPDLWADIFLTNKAQIARAGRLFEKYYGGIIKAISNGDRKRLINLLKKAKANRDAAFDHCH